MPRGNHHTWTALTALITVLSLSGCSSGQAPSTGGGPETISGAGPVATIATPAAAATNSTSPPDVVAAIPPAARKRTADGAEAFVRYFLTVTNELSTRPTTGVLPQLATPSCKTCKGLEQRTAAMITKKERYLGPALRVQEVGGLAGHPEVDATYSVGAIAQEGDYPIVDEAGVTVARVPLQTSAFEFELTWSRGRWFTNALRTFNR